MKTLSDVIGKIAKWLNYGSMGALIFAVAVIFLDVMIRLISAHSILGSYEMAEMAMIVIIYLAMARTQLLDGHVHVEFIVKKLPSLPRSVIMRCMSGISVAICAILTITTYQQMMNFFYSNTSTGVVKIPLYPIAFIMFIGLLLFTITLIMELFQKNVLADNK